jgi:cell division protein FtsI/penicillin-binding protein 2
MVAVRRICVLLLLAVLAGAPPAGPLSLSYAGSRDMGRSLYTQSAAQVLAREFDSGEVSFLLLDARTGTLLAAHWENPEKPIPMGSLLKPFTALAYGEEHQFRYPTQVCAGEAGGCWRPGGHGEIGIVSAIAHSCNAYFRKLTVDMDSEDVAPTAIEFGLDAPAAGISGAALIGVGNRWVVSPVHMARAYLELIRRRDQPGAREVLAGMAQSARQGTGLEVGRALHHSSSLVKTGTAACTHLASHAPGDGFVVAMLPAERPEILLLVRVHGVPGSRAAVTAGRMLSRIEE